MSAVSPPADILLYFAKSIQQKKRPAQSAGLKAE